MVVGCYSYQSKIGSRVWHCSLLSILSIYHKSNATYRALFWKKRYHIFFIFLRDQKKDIKRCQLYVASATCGRTVRRLLPVVVYILFTKLQLLRTTVKDTAGTSLYDVNISKDKQRQVKISNVQAEAWLSTYLFVTNLRFVKHLLCWLKG